MVERLVHRDSHSSTHCNSHVNQDLGSDMIPPLGGRDHGRIRRPRQTAAAEELAQAQYVKRMFTGSRFSSVGVADDEPIARDHRPDLW